MPTRWELRLTGTAPERPVRPAQLHGLAATLLEAPGADHHSQHKPYSVSPLLTTGTQAVLRLGWLDDSRPLDLTTLDGRKIRLGAQFFVVDSVRAAHLSYRELLELPGTRHAVIEFVSATYFSRNGLWYPLPDPRLVFGGLIRRWNQHCPPPHALTGADDFLSRLAISAVSLTSTPIDPGYGLRIGYTGTCAYTIPETPDPRDETLLSALAGFALTSGIGAQTTHGLGHVDTTLG